MTYLVAIAAMSAVLAHLLIFRHRYRKLRHAYITANDHYQNLP